MILDSWLSAFKFIVLGSVMFTASCGGTSQSSDTARSQGPAGPDHSGVASAPSGVLPEGSPSPSSTAFGAAPPMLSAGSGGAAAFSPNSGVSVPDANAAAGPNAGDQYLPVGTNPFVITSHDPLSTFGVDVDTASYDLFRRDINLVLIQKCCKSRSGERLLGVMGLRG